MANNNAANVTAGKPKVGGAVFRAPFGTALPTTADATLNEAFINLGYCTEDGLVNANTPTKEVVRAWGGDVVLTTQTEKNDTFNLTLIEVFNTEVLKVRFGATNVTGTLSTGISVTANADEDDLYSYVIDMIGKGDVMHRIVIPQADLTEIGDITYVDNAPVGYPITLTAISDANGVTHKEYFKQA